MVGYLTKFLEGYFLAVALLMHMNGQVPERIWLPKYFGNLL